MANKSTKVKKVKNVKLLVIVLCILIAIAVVLYLYKLFTVKLDRITATYNGKDIVVGGTLNKSDITVQATYTDNSTQIVTKFTLSGFDSSILGKQTVTVSYTEGDVTKSATITVTVVENSGSDDNPDDTVANMYIHFMELGNNSNGDSIYIKAGDTDILIDAGSSSGSAATIQKYINQYCTDGILEYVIVTHADSDHIAAFTGSSGGIFDMYECQTIIQFARTNKNTDVLNKYYAKRDAEVKAGANCYTALDCVNETNGAQKVYEIANGITMEILYQKYYEENTSNENDYSVCVMFTQGDNHYLFLGDLEEAGEKSLVECNPDLPEVELYKAGHHGSPTSANEVLLEVIKPKYVCVSCVAGHVEYTQNLENTFPSQAFINRIAPYTDNVYVTTMGRIKKNPSTGRWGSDGYESMNGNIIFSCVDGVISIHGSNNDTKLKDTDWFKNNRTCPPAWAN